MSLPPEVRKRQRPSEPITVFLSSFSCSPDCPQSPQRRRKGGKKRSRGRGGRGRVRGFPAEGGEYSEREGGGEEQAASRKLNFRRGRKFDRLRCRY